MLAGGGEVFFLAGAVDGQLALGLRRGDEIFHGISFGCGLFGRGLGFRSGGFGGGGSFGRAAAGSKSEHHDQRQKQCQILFHFRILHFVMLR